MCGGRVVQGQQVEKNLGFESENSGFDPNYIETLCLPAEGLSSRKQTINAG